MAIFLNEDYENFMAFRSDEELNEAGLRQQVKDYFRGQTRGIFFNVNAQRAYYDSRVFEPVWKNIEKNAEGKYIHRGVEFFDKPLPTLSNTLGAKKLHDNVGNPFPIRLDECRKQGGMGCITMRMNDCHLGDFPESPMHSDLWYEHPEWRISNSGLNYAIPQVRIKAMALIREIFEIFDMDAFEIDWMRTPPFFVHGHEEEGREYLNDIMAFAAAEKEKAEQRRGHKIWLTTRVPSRPEEALLLGLDVWSWVKQKFVDMVVPCAFICSVDSSMPLEIWRQLLGDDVKIVPGIDIVTTPSPGTPFFTNVAEFVYGYAAAFYHHGAEDIYLFNHMDRMTGLKDKDSYRKLLGCLGDRTQVEKCFRRHVSTMVNNIVPGLKFASNLPIQAQEYWQFARIENGSGFDGREITVLFAFESETPLKPSDFEFSVNEVVCPDVSCGSDLAVTDDKWQKLVCKVPEGVLQPGSSVVGVRAARENVNAALRWCEIDIK